MNPSGWRALAASVLLHAALLGLVVPLLSRLPDVKPGFGEPQPTPGVGTGKAGILAVDLVGGPPGLVDGLPGDGLPKHENQELVRRAASSRSPALPETDRSPPGPQTAPGAESAPATQISEAREIPEGFEVSETREISDEPELFEPREPSEAIAISEADDDLEVGGGELHEAGDAVFADGEGEMGPGEPLAGDGSGLAGRGAQAGGLLGESDVIPPAPLHAFVPRLPRGIAADRVRGVSVKVLVHVTSEGEVDEVKLQQGSGLEPLDKAVLEAAGRLRYTPGVAAGAATAMWTEAELSF